MLRVPIVFLFCLRHPPDRKKKCVARAAHGGGSGRYRTGRMEKNANGVTIQPKLTHGRTWRGNNNSCCGSCSLAWSWSGIYITTTTKTRLGLAWAIRHCTALVILRGCVSEGCVFKSRGGNQFVVVGI